MHQGVVPQRSLCVKVGPLFVIEDSCSVGPVMDEYHYFFFVFLTSYLGLGCELVGSGVFVWLAW